MPEPPGVEPPPGPPVLPPVPEGPELPGDVPPVPVLPLPLPLPVLPVPRAGMSVLLPRLSRLASPGRARVPVVLVVLVVVLGVDERAPVPGMEVPAEAPLPVVPLPEVPVPVVPPVCAVARPTQAVSRAARAMGLRMCCMVGQSFLKR